LGAAEVQVLRAVVEAVVVKVVVVVVQVLEIRKKLVHLLDCLQKFKI
jgi:hypothetical protein